VGGEVIELLAWNAHQCGVTGARVRIAIIIEIPSQEYPYPSLHRNAFAVLDDQRSSSRNKNYALFFAESTNLSLIFNVEIATRRILSGKNANPERALRCAVNCKPRTTAYQ
jgi:hypothetical protein